MRRKKRQQKREHLFSLEKEIAEVKLENSQLREIIIWLSKKP